MSLVTPSLRSIVCARPEAPQGKRTTLTSPAFGFGLLLAEPAHGDLRIGVDDGRDRPGLKHAPRAR